MTQHFTYNMSDTTENTVAQPEHRGRGFASMDRERQRAIAAKGGRAAHRYGRAHEWTASEAVQAGRKGGLANHQNRF